MWQPERTCLQAYGSLTAIRPCGPKKDAIRAATYDMLDDRGFDAFQHLPPESYAWLSPEQKSIVQHKLQ